MFGLSYVEKMHFSQHRPMQDEIFCYLDYIRLEELRQVERLRSPCGKHLVAGFSPRKHRFDPRRVYVRFAVDKGQ